MGLMDNIKNAQEMAKKAQEAGVQPPTGAPEVPGGLEYSQWMQKMAMEGEDATGTITAIEETGTVSAGAKEFMIKVDAEKDGEAYEARAMQYLHPNSEEGYTVGKKFNLKVDPSDKTKALLMGGVT